MASPHQEMDRGADDARNDGRKSLESIERSPTAGKSLKKKKSLTRMFSLSRRKSFKSRPASPDEPPLPILTNDYSSSSPWSTIPSSSSSRPATANSYRTFSRPGAYDHHVLDKTSIDLPSPSIHLPHQNPAGAIAMGTEIDPSGSPSMLRTDSMVDEDLKIPPSARRAKLSPVQKPKFFQNYTHPNSILQNRTERGLHVPDPFSLKTRNRGASTSSHQPPDTPPNAIIPPRPHTAVLARFPDTPNHGRQHTPMQLGSARKADSPVQVEPMPPMTKPRLPWETEAEVRASFKSAVTTGSSQIDSASTDRSSIFTKNSSLSELTMDLPERPSTKDEGGMTVDEAINMYSAGFEDDFPHDDDDEYLDKGKDAKYSSSFEDSHRRSVKIAEAMNDSIDSTMKLPTSMSSPELLGHARKGSRNMSIETSSPEIPPPTPGSLRDDYGFQKHSHYISTSQFDAWHTEYAIIQDRRNKKWEVYMREQGLSTIEPGQFPDRSAKLERYIRKGIPPSWRGAAWFFYAGGNDFLQKNPGLYDELVLRSQTPELKENDKDSIERDLHRTFPDNIHFKPDIPLSAPDEAPLLFSLRRVLCAFALHHPRIGYCQSLNFVAGLLLLFLSEEKSFWMLHIITTSYLPATHEMSLEGANVDLWVLMSALKEAIPSIWAKIGGKDVSSTATRLPPISLCTTSWFMSLFIGTLPIESVLRVWDVLFYEGSRTLFRIAIAIFKLGENEIRGVSDPMEIFQVVQALPRGMLHIGALMDVACRRGGVSQAWVEKKRNERRQWYANERARVAAGGAAKDQPVEKEAIVVQQKPARSRANSGWRRRVGLEK
ncbi:hypothetical protein MMC09_000460 [Bachmanniomyces sp. S44760]|nr:hypothetical protein [Bachmanniomyces sp. S44760]